MFRVLHDVDSCLSKVVVGMVQVLIFVMKFTGGHDEAERFLFFHPYVTAHLGFVLQLRIPHSCW